MGYNDTIEYLYGLQQHGIKLGLENPIRLLEMLGNPQNSFRSVHIAGTNGKGSTAAMLCSVMEKAGYSTGLFTSPHLVSFTERIRVNGSEITPEEVVSLTEEIRGASNRAGLNPTFFEVVTAMGFLHFRRKAVEWAVVETGMGGRLDATNILMPEAVIITSISLDHAEFLGETIEEVAGEKAGIIKGSVPAVVAGQEDATRDIIAKKAEEKESPLILYGKDFRAEIKNHGPGEVVFDFYAEDYRLKRLAVPLSGIYQAENASLAIKAFQVISGAPKEKELFEAAVRRGLASLKWPGRLELIKKDPPVYIDGAHNPAAARALAETLREDYLSNGGKLTLIIGTMSDKDVQGIITPLLPLAEEVIFTAPDYGRAASPQELAKYAREMGYANVKAASPVSEALALAVKTGRMVLVTGSFYTTGAAKEALSSGGFEIGLRE